MTFPSSFLSASSEFVCNAYMYLKLFPSHAASACRVSWAKRLCAQIRDKRWLHKNLHPAVTNVSTRIQYNTEMNILFVKLHLLDPTAVVPTFNFLSKGRYPSI